MRKFTPQYTPIMAYIIAVLIGDGSASRHVELMIAKKDEPFIDSFATALTQIGLHPVKKDQTYIYKNKPRPFCRVIACNKVFVDWYKALTFTDIQNIATVSNEHQLAFLKGFYESEGTFYSDKQNSIDKIAMNSRTLEYVQLIKQILDSYNLLGKIYSTTSDGKPYHKVILHRKGQAKKFLELVNPCIKKGEKRKYENTNGADK